MPCALFYNHGFNNTRNAIFIHFQRSFCTSILFDQIAILENLQKLKKKKRKATLVDSDIINTY